MKRFIMIMLSLALISSVNAGVEVKQFENPQQEQRYKRLVNELRCLVCQNQNLADSNAPLAVDLRNKVYAMINDGKSDKEIMEFMVARYGDFVLYRTPLKISTLLLWAGPFIIFIIALVILLRLIAQRRKLQVTELSQADKEKVSKLLDEKTEQEK